ncbi:prestin-like isoform X2 [Bacillus rossius redtenbacheri]|uniref:prestin-like isoform X2 n=1 Tax=Bacillus rossius redtenbacheri TaxID=93214 RepID=UPI002FDDE583
MSVPDNTRIGDEEEVDSLNNGHLHPDYLLQPCKKTEFDQLYQYTRPRKPALRKRLVKTNRCQPRKFVVSLFPILSWLPEYTWKKNLIRDIISGFTVAIMHIPQGMAYAMLGGVPPVVGIYMAFFPVLIYFLMGTSRHVSMGTFAVVCMMTSKSVLLYSTPEVPPPVANSSLADFGNGTAAAAVAAVTNSSSGLYTPVQVATAVCFMVGMWQVALGVLRLGVVSVLLSDTLVSGFTTGAAVHVFTSQVSNLLGIKTRRHSGALKLVYTYIDIFKNIQSANVAAIVISAVSITILGFYNEVIKPRINKKLPMPLPVELMAVIAGTLASMFLHLQEEYSVRTVGNIPTGLPLPEAPPFALLPNLVIDGLIIAIVAFSVNLSMASIFARKHNYPVDANQELLASGCANIFGSFFSCIPFAASLSRSLIQETVGGVTQLASVVSCLLLLLVLLLIGPFFEPLPNSVLASIVVVALKGMFMQMREVPGAWRLSPADGLVWVTTFLCVVLLDIDYGLGAGMALSLLCVLVMGQRPKVFRLGHVPSTNIYLDVNRYQAAEEVPGVVILQIAGGLHFANKERVLHKIYQLVGDLPPVKSKKSPIVKNTAGNESSKDKKVDQLLDKQVSCVVLDMMAVAFVDPSAVRALLLLHKDLSSRGVLFCLADCSATVYEKLIHCDFFFDFSDSFLFATVHDAVQYALLEKDA